MESPCGSLTPANAGREHLPICLHVHPPLQPLHPAGRLGGGHPLRALWRVVSRHGAEQSAGREAGSREHACEARGTALPPQVERACKRASPMGHGRCQNGDPTTAPHFCALLRAPPCRNMIWGLSEQLYGGAAGKSVAVSCMCLRFRSTQHQGKQALASWVHPTLHAG